MKKHLILLLPFLFLTGCASFTVTMEEDPFKGVEIVTADMWHTVIESSIDNRRVLYRKEIRHGVISDPVVTFNFAADSDSYYHYHGEGISPEAFILADNKSLPVKVTNISRTVRTYPVVVGTYLYYPFQQDIVIGVGTRYFLSGKITLTPEIQDAIMSATRYMIRFYVGENPLTLQATDKQLEAVKKFLLAGPPQAEQK